MTRWIWILLLAGCTATKLTHFRKGFNSCHATDANVIECDGKPMAQVECFHPGEEACGALAIRYSDGERIFLVRPPGFEPGPEREAALEYRAAIRPELASDAQLIWFKPAQVKRDVWVTYEPQTGVTNEVDNFKIFQIREKDPHSMPLWVAAESK